WWQSLAPLLCFGLITPSVADHLDQIFVKRRRFVMANKQSFSPEEWIKILESTMLAGMAVSAADPSGVWGLVKEGFASSSALAAAKSDAGSSDLIKGVVAEYE